MLAEWHSYDLNIQRTEARVYVDDNADLLYVFKVGSISAHSLPLTSRAAPSTPDAAASRPTVLSVLQGNDVIHFFDVQTGQSFIQALHCSKQSKALQEAANANLPGILWAKYQHHSRLLVVATDFDLVVMQITGQRGITRLKHFSLSKLYGTVATAGIMRPEHVTIVRSHQLTSADTGTRMYVCVVDAAREAIRVLSLSATEVTYLGDLEWPAKEEAQQAQVSLRAGDIAFSVVDNIVAMHCLRLGTVALYDFLLQPSMPADGSPVPLFDPVAVVTQEAGSAGSSKALGPPASARYLPPCHAIDLDSLTLYRFKVDLQACLTRTSLPPGKRFLSLSERGTLEWPWLREQQIVSLQQFLKSSPSLDYATKVFDNINSRFAAHARRSSDMAALQVLKPSDIVNDVLLWLHKAGTAAPARVEAYVSSFGLSARRYSIILPPAHGALLLQCISSQGKALQAGLVLRGMAPVWSRPAMAHALQAQTSSGALQGAWVWCARLWARVLLTHTAAIGPRNVSHPAVKAEAVDGYVRCLLECNDISGAAAGLRDSLGPRNDEAAAAVVAKAGDVDPLVHAAVRRCCAVATPEPRS